MRKALLVGINKYQNGSNLYGCVNDITNIRDILINYYGYQVADIRVLADERATYDNIMDRLGWLITDAQEGDNLVFHYSGHGSQIRDRNGDELKDDMDEIICPHDMNWEDKYISDDQFAEIFNRMNGGTLDVILDSCHSGTGTRNPYRTRYMKPPVDILCRQEDGLPIRGLFSWFMSIFAGANDEADKPFIRMNHSLLAGARCNQTAADADIDGIPNGAFTYFLCKHIRLANGNITRSILKNRTKDSLKYNGFDQVPQLEAPKKLFHGLAFT